MRIPHLATAAVVGAAVLTVPAPALASASCSWTPLTPPTGFASLEVDASGGNGVYYAGDAGLRGGGPNQAILWQNGVPRSLGAAFGAHTDVYDVNASGTVVGGAGGRPVRHRDGAWERLPIPAGATATATDVNNAGDVFGQVDFGKLILWPAARPGTYEMITSPFPGYNFAMDLDDDGTLLARGVKGGGLTPSAVRTPDGVWTELAPGTSEIASAIAGDRIVGENFEWNRTGALVRTLPVVSSLDVNPAGQVLVQQRPADGARLEPQVWRDGAVEATYPPVDGTPVTPIALDDDGAVLGELRRDVQPPESPIPLIGRCA